jgi:high-affinity K+ transport system ATPase subunit B
MNNLNPVVLLVPLSALLAVIILYVHLSKKSTSRGHFKLFISILILFAVLFNFLWEMLQMPLYKAMGNNIQAAVFCALAAVADAIMILLLYLGLAFIYKNPFWIEGLQ